jgi:hypothetical protein
MFTVSYCKGIALAADSFHRRRPINQQISAKRPKSL